MNYFDIVFIDTTAYKFYDSSTLEYSPLGGTEASLLRTAKALADAGLKVLLMNHLCEAPIYDGKLLITPLIADIKCGSLISLRGYQLFDKIQYKRCYSYHQDDPTDALLKMRDKFLEHNTVVVGVSRWHKTQLEDKLLNRNEEKNPKVTYVYNPVPDALYDLPKLDYDKNKLLWVSSPHKGLKEAVQQFSILKKILPKIELHVFNPGYFKDQSYSAPGVYFRGAQPAPKIWEEMRTALCVFYPTTFRETFGCIAAEANALHCPVATHAIAALNESVCSREQLIEKGNNPALLKTVEHWYNGYRPSVSGQERFKMSNILRNWAYLLSRKG